MDLDKEFVRAVLKEGEPAYKLAIDRGFDSDKLQDEGKLAWEYMVAHRKQYGALPSLDIVQGSVVNINGEPINLSAQMLDPAAALLDKLLERKVVHLLLQATKDIEKQLSNRDVTAALEVWREIHRKLQQESLSVSKVESLFSLGREVIDYYDMMKAGMMGIPTPWPTMDNQTLGWWKEDLVLLVGRLGQGKTWMLLLLTHAAWKPGNQVLICTTEMSRKALAMRFLSLHFRIPYGAFRKGRLSQFVEDKMREGILSLMGDQGIKIVGSDFDYSIDSLSAAVEDEKPALLVVDGAYLIKNSGKDRQEKVANTFDDFKRIGKRQQISVLTATQFNRQAKAGQEESITADNIGITDVAGWNADAAFGLMQTQEMFEKNIMGIKALKVREGKAELFQINWDLENMDFSEIRDPNLVVTNLKAPVLTEPEIDNGDSDDDDLHDVGF